VRLDATIYRYTFSNLQLTSFDASQSAYFIKNAGKARTTGIESSITWQATPELSFTGGAAYNRAKFVDFRNAQCPALLNPGTPAQVVPPCMVTTLPNGAQQVSYDRTGQALPRAPKGTFSAGFNYERPVGGDLKFGIGAEGIHTSSYVISETGDQSVNQQPFWRLNANVKVAAEDDKWELALIGRNLTNEYIGVISNDKVFSSPGIVAVYSVRPREIVLQGTVKF
jgi:iron complex outermembrane receptor protein